MSDSPPPPEDDPVFTRFEVCGKCHSSPCECDKVFDIPSESIIKHLQIPVIGMFNHMEYSKETEEIKMSFSYEIPKKHNKNLCSYILLVDIDSGEIHGMCATPTSMENSSNNLTKLANSIKVLRTQAWFSVKNFLGLL